LANPSEDGGRDEFREFAANRRSKSDTCTFSSTISALSSSITAACSTTKAASCS
jgi:hypothetical protein